MTVVPYLPPVTQSVVADTDLSAKSYHFVNFDATDNRVVNIAAAATVLPFVLQLGVDGSSEDKDVTIAVAGGSKLYLGGTVKAGDFLTSDAAGKGIKTTTDTNFYGAIALSGGVSGDLIPVLVVQGTFAG